MIIVLAALISVAIAAPQLDEAKEAKWNAFKIMFDKNYSPMEEKIRRGIFEDNMQSIERHNKDFNEGVFSYETGVNEFSDMTHSEFKDMYLVPHLSFDNKTGNFLEVPEEAIADLPSEVDWRRKGAVNVVKQQGHCGSCWSFSATSTIESAVFLAHGHLMDLSEQQFVDCSTENHGCKGGWPTKAFDYAVKVGGVMSEGDYHYKAKDQQCKFDKYKVAAKIDGHNNIRYKHEDDLKFAVATKGPVSVLIDSSPKHFHSYKRGVYDDSACSQDINHAVVVVGYGTEGGKDYWLVRNSWGSSWGDHGYIKMARNKNNQCAIASFASYPFIN